MMPRINVKANFTAPGEINIPLVRADVAMTCEIFRIFFEIFLALFSSVLGYCLSLAALDKIHWFTLIILGGAALVFLIISIVVNVNARKDLTTSSC